MLVKRKTGNAKLSKRASSRKRNGGNATRSAKRNLPAQYAGLQALVRFANLLHGQSHAVAEAREVYVYVPPARSFSQKPSATGWSEWVQNSFDSAEGTVTVTLDRRAMESEAARIRAEWQKLIAPIWQAALREFPSVRDRAALPGLADGDADELITAALAVDKILRLIASHAAEGALLPIRLPRTQIAIDPRITINPATGEALIVQDLMGDAILPAIKRKGVDLRRLRVCPVCGRLFVAPRRDSMACSPGCVSAERQRRFRSAEKREEYREHLKRNRKARLEKKKRDARRARAKGD